MKYFRTNTTLKTIIPPLFQCFSVLVFSSWMLLGCELFPTEQEKGDEPSPLWSKNNADLIFYQDTLHSFALNLSDSALAVIDANPSAEEYVEGELIFGNDTISPVGIRYKGSKGAFVGCLSNPNWRQPSGYKTCTKLSIKVKINWLDSDKKFYGLKKLQFHSQNLDISQMHERLGYWMFREMGVPAPRSVHARLVINGVYSGVYALTVLPPVINGPMFRRKTDPPARNKQDTHYKRSEPAF